MTRVLLVDDSAMARRLIGRILLKEGDFEIVGEAGDPYVAREKIAELHPDVLVLDVEMPRMDGISFLERLMRHFPLPVVVCSTLTMKGGETALRALEAGAVGVVCKPSPEYPASSMAVDLVAAVRAAALARRMEPLALASSFPERTRPSTLAPAPHALGGRPDVRVIAIGASTGGTVAVEKVVKKLLPDSPPVLIVQHLPAYITAAFAGRLHQLSPLTVSEARDGEFLKPGTVLVSPGDVHMTLERSGAELRVRLRAGAKVNGHQPSVDVLFQSIAELAAPQSIGVLLTGMGRDGAAGLLAMRESGATTIAQDEASSVVWGMPKAAIDVGGAQIVLALDGIASRLNQLTRKRARPGASMAPQGS